MYLRYENLEMFNLLEIEELRDDYGFKEGHLRAVARERADMAPRATVKVRARQRGCLLTANAEAMSTTTSYYDEYYGGGGY